MENKLGISHVTRYMKIPGTNLPVEMEIKDDTLHFSNGMILDNDQQYIDMILQEKVAHIEEVNRKKHCLTKTMFLVTLF